MAVPQLAVDMVVQALEVVLTILAAATADKIKAAAVVVVEAVVVAAEVVVVVVVAVEVKEVMHLTNQLRSSHQ